mmetsp:Transcript_17187/g.41219  ORF Transcript_17187/g.41219 Transcript_17187/m.41219 type:complete len:208 (-) Transcript_17187:271-894(-)
MFVVQLRLVDAREELGYRNQQARQYGDDCHRIVVWPKSKFAEVRNDERLCEYVPAHGIDKHLDQNGQEAGPTVAGAGGGYQRVENSREAVFAVVGLRDGRRIRRTDFGGPIHGGRERRRFRSVRRLHPSARPRGVLGHLDIVRRRRELVQRIGNHVQKPILRREIPTEALERGIEGIRPQGGAGASDDWEKGTGVPEGHQNAHHGPT